MTDHTVQKQEIKRCPICDWPLAETREKGCVPGDCCYRPEENSPEWHRIRERRRAISGASRP